MSRATAVLGAVLLAACAGDPQPEPPPPPPPAPTVADFAGQWALTSVLPDSPDTATAVMGGSAAGTDWVLDIAEDRDPVPMQVSMSGDSLVAVTAPFESTRRPGEMVTARVAGVMQDGRFMGNIVLTYDPDGTQEVVAAPFTGTPAPGDPAPME